MMSDNGIRDTVSGRHMLSSFSVILVFVLFIIIGISLVPRINLQLKPTRSTQNITVSYLWPRASAKVIEQEVTSVLEGVFSRITGVEEIRSITSVGKGEIQIALKKNARLDAIRFEIASSIRQVFSQLPDQVSYPLISVGTSGKNAQPILTYTLNSHASPGIIQKYAEDHLVDKVASITGVSEVEVYGSTPFEWEIAYDYDKISSLGISVAQIISSINHVTEEQNMGLVMEWQKDVQKTMPLVVRSKTNGAAEWQHLPVANRHGRIVYLSDIATMRLRERLPNTYHRINGLNTINMVIYPEDHENHLRLVSEIKETMRSLSASLPPGYSISTAYDTTEFIAKELRKIGFRTILATLILLGFVLIVSRQLKYLMLILFSLTTNLVISVIFYYVLKLEIHLYSLAGMTISLGMIIDNTIVMVDHYHHHKNLNVFLAILAATVTTIGALSMVFLLDVEQQINLYDFALVISVNLFVSLLIALFFIPALMDTIRLATRKKTAFTKRKRTLIRTTVLYGKSIVFARKYRWLMIIVFVLGFGLPVQWLPEKLEGSDRVDLLYNKTFGSNAYQQTAKPYVEKLLGGSLRLFTEFVFESSFYSEPDRTTLYVQGTMPEGCTVQQLNDVVLKMENFISQYKEVELFQTSITSYHNSTIKIFFKKEHEFGAFPYFLKDAITGKAIGLGGLDWGVYGVGRGFSNAISSGYKNSSIKLEGYNYEQLYAYATDLGVKLLDNPRIREYDIQGDNGWSVNTLHEYNMDFNEDALAQRGINIAEFYTELLNRINYTRLNPVYTKDGSLPVNLKSANGQYAALWHFRNEPIAVNSAIMKLGDVATVSKQKTGNDIYKKDQQYQLYILYDFIGPGKLMQMVRDEYIEKTKPGLALGYKVSDGRDFSFLWDKENKKQYYLVFLVIIIVYMICSILLESLLQPLAIISMIPISFIGVFLTFYLFDINFDQGGFASFILLSGLVVNAGLYIINDFNNLRKKYPGRAQFDLYLKAYNQKIIPVLLTIVSSVLGLIPFIWQGQNEVFWFAFASGAIGGLVFSLVAIWIYLPLFMSFKQKH